MKSLLNLDMKLDYSSSLNQMIDEFYRPVLAQSSQYDRATGFFSSGIFWAIEGALNDFIASGGKMRIICSPRLSPLDKSAIESGSTSRLNFDESLESSLQKELNEWDEAFGSRAPSSILRHLIESGVLEMKFAVPRTSDSTSMFHDKFGIFTDVDGNRVAFNGSLNESLSGWTAYGVGNHESFQVFTSWRNDTDLERSDRICKTFEYHWNEKSDFLNYYGANRLSAIFKPREDDLTEEQALSNLRASRINRQKGSRRSVDLGSPRELQEHQALAIKNWNDSGKRGIISFVTGGGKTIAALAIARDWVSKSKVCLICVPTRDLLKQWVSEIHIELGQLANELVQAGAGVGPSQWINDLRSMLEQQHGGIIIATYDSAQDHRFIRQFERYSSDLLFIADEVHEIGSQGNQKILLGVNAEARLGLSATPERYGDEDGTNRIFQYFGNKLEPVFGFTEARRAGRLCEYVYKLSSAYLSDIEQELFDNLSRRIQIETFKIKDGSGSRERVNQLLRDRARIVKQCENKMRVASELLHRHLIDREWSDREPHWLIYCNSINHLNSIRGMVASRLGEKGIRTLEYHSQLSGGERDAVLDIFERSGGALFAVKCLDEGIDIPSINGAIVVASSTNPREYIQRRGRILRSAPNKPFAELYDIITLTTGGRLALSSELSRFQEIAKHALNREQVTADWEYITDTKAGIISEEFEPLEDNDE